MKIVIMVTFEKTALKGRFKDDQNECNYILLTVRTYVLQVDYHLKNFSPTKALVLIFFCYVSAS